MTPTHSKFVWRYHFWRATKWSEKFSNFRKFPIISELILGPANDDIRSFSWRRLHSKFFRMSFFIFTVFCYQKSFPKMFFFKKLKRTIFVRYSLTIFLLVLEMSVRQTWSIWFLVILLVEWELDILFVPWGEQVNLLTCFRAKSELELGIDFRSIPYLMTHLSDHCPSSGYFIRGRSLKTILWPELTSYWCFKAVRQKWKWVILSA